jgi:hypothetical protein
VPHPELVVGVQRYVGLGFAAAERYLRCVDGEGARVGCGQVRVVVVEEECGRDGGRGGDEAAAQARSAAAGARGAGGGGGGGGGGRGAGECGAGAQDAVRAVDVSGGAGEVCVRGVCEPGRGAVDAHREWHGVRGVAGGEEDGEDRVGDAAGGVRGEGAGGRGAGRGRRGPGVARCGLLGDGRPNCRASAVEVAV